MKTFQTVLIKGLIFFICGLCSPELTAQTYSHLIAYDFHEFRMKVLDQASRKIAIEVNSFLDMVEDSIRQNSYTNNTAYRLGGISMKDKFFLRRKGDFHVFFSVEDFSEDQQVFRGTDSVEFWYIEQKDMVYSNSSFTNTYTSKFNQKLTGSRALIKAVLTIYPPMRKKNGTPIEISAIVGKGTSMMH